MHLKLVIFNLKQQICSSLLTPLLQVLSQEVVWKGQQVNFAFRKRFMLFYFKHLSPTPQNNHLSLAKGNKIDVLFCTDDCFSNYFYLWIKRVSYPGCLISTETSDFKFQDWNSLITPFSKLWQLCLSIIKEPSWKKSQIQFLTFGVL